tara:strand:+ start:14872 stop:15690 length:819 start_codon:yes stop_codon:yes gene_type:complete
MNERNFKYDNAIRKSQFGSISRLSEYLNLSYRNVESYALLERRPVDRNGVVKYDVAAICQALECDLDDLFPENFVDRPYRFRESYADGYGQRAKKVPVKRHFPERDLTPVQADVIIKALAFSRQVEADIAHEFALKIIQRLKPEHYAAIEAKLLSPERASEDVPEKQYEAALKALSSPANLRVLQRLKGRDTLDAPPRKAAKTLQRENDLKEIQRYFEAGLLPGDAFIDAPDVPPGLNPRVVTQWMGKKRPKIAEDHLAYILERCRALAQVE